MAGRFIPVRRAKLATLEAVGARGGDDAGYRIHDGRGRMVELAAADALRVALAILRDLECDPKRPEGLGPEDERLTWSEPEEEAGEE